MRRLRLLPRDGLEEEAYELRIHKEIELLAAWNGDFSWLLGDVPGFFHVFRLFFLDFLAFFANVPRFSQPFNTSEASGRLGFLRGVSSLQQLLGLAWTEGWAHLPGQRILDTPRFQHRGLMLDVSRHYFPVDFLKRLLDWMFLYKLNVFHWHLTDDEAWRLELQAFPNLTAFGAWRGVHGAVEPQLGGAYGRYGGAYSRQEVKDVVRYAAQRGIQVLPEIDVPGHCYALLKAMPDLKAPGETRSVQNFKGNVLDVRKESTYRFLERVFEEAGAS